MLKWAKELGLFLVALFEALYRDLLGLYLLIRTENRLAQMVKREEVLHDIFRALVRKHPNKPCIICNGRIWTFQNVITKKESILEMGRSLKRKVLVFLYEDRVAFRVHLE